MHFLIIGTIQTLVIKNQKQQHLRQIVHKYVIIMIPPLHIQSADAEFWKLSKEEFREKAIEAIEKDQKETLEHFKFHQKNGNKYGLQSRFDAERRTLRRIKRIIKLL